MNRIQISTFVSIFLAILSSTADSIEYFIYMPNTIVLNSVHNIPVYLSHPPAIITFSFSSKFDPIQNFLLTENLNDVALQIFISNVSVKILAIQITLRACNSLDNCYNNLTSHLLTSKTYQIPFSEKSHFIELVTSKECYKPNEKLFISVIIIGIDEILNRKFSNASLIEWVNGKFLQKTLRQSQPNKKPSILKLDLYDANNKSIKSWSKNTQNKSFTIEYILPKNSVSGIWKIIYHLLDTTQHEYYEFKLLPGEYNQLPLNAKMNISIKFNDDITILTKNIRFIVCAEYSKIRSVKGKLFGTICLKNNEEDLTNERPCLKFESTMNGSSKCLWIDAETDRLQLKNMSYSQQLNRLIITVNIIDEYSQKNHFYRFIGPILKNSNYKLVFLSSPYFKSLLPYYGKMQTLKHNDKPFANASVVIQCNNRDFRYNWGHFSKHTSDKDGIIYFILPSPPIKLEIIICDIEDLSFIEDNSETVKYYRSSITQTLEKSKSSKAKNIQLKLFDRKGTLSNQELIKLELQSVSVLSEDLMVLLVANGQIIKSKYVKHSQLPKNGCQKRDDELGHYVCDASTNKTICMEDWTGNNCLTPKCKSSCNNGICVQVNHCYCKHGWTGTYCNKCVPSKGCVNGACVEGNDCICSPGWIGYNCDIEGTYLQNETRLHRKLFKKSVSLMDMQRTEINSIFTTIITWKIPSLITAMTIIVHSISKSPASTTLILEPTHSLNKDNITLYKMKTQNCIHYDPYQLLQMILGNIITIDPKNIPFQTSLYDEMAFEQCRIPFSNIPNFSVPINSNIVAHFPQIENDDFLNLFQSLNLFPITTMKIVSRTCPLWKIISTIHKANVSIPNVSSTNPVISNPTQNFNINKKFKICRYETECDKIYTDLFQMPQSIEPYLISSLCVNTSNSGTVFVKNHKINIKPPFLVTISGISNLQVKEIHHQTIEIYNLIDSILEIEIAINSETQCLASEFHKTILVKIMPQKTFKLSQNVQFNCSGVFSLIFNFRTKWTNSIFPSNSNDTNSYPMEKTEQVVYHVYSGALKQQKFNYQFCRNEIQNSTVELNLLENFSALNYISFQIKIQNGLERFLDYLRYIYRNQQLNNIISLTMRIYELNLTKKKKYLNQSLINIKKMIEVESKVLKSIQRSIPFDYEALLLNLCIDIPNHLYIVKRKFCKLLETKLTLTQFSADSCANLRGKFDEIVFTASISINKESKYFQSKNKNELGFIKSCLLKSNSGFESKIYLENIDRIMKNDSLSLKRWLDDNENVINLNHLAFLYVITKDNFQFKFIRYRTVKKILHNIIDNPKRISKISAIVLLKILADNEENFPNSFYLERANQNTETIKTFSQWSKNQKLEVELPKFYSCSNVEVSLEYFKEISMKEINNDYIDFEEKSSNCNSTELSLILKKPLKHYKSIILHLPTGWTIEKLTIESISRQLSPCNIFFKNKNDFFQIEFDFYLPLNECHTSRIPLKLLRYQKISNLQATYATITTENNSEFYMKFSIKNCPENSQSTINNRNRINTSDKSISIKEFCDNHKEIQLILKDKFLSIENTKITITSKKSIISNKILLFDLKNIITEIEIDRIIWWFLNNYNLKSCDSGWIIKNLLNSYSEELVAPKNLSNCITIETESIMKKSFYQTICRKLINIYSIKSINSNKNSMKLKQLTEPCNFNSQQKNEFEMDFITDNSCTFLKKISKFPKLNFLLLSVGNLRAVRRPLNLNNEYVFISLVNK